MALALPLGMGLTALATLALGELGWLNFVGLSVLLAVLIELGIVAWFRLFRETAGLVRKRVSRRAAGRRCRCSSRAAWASCWSGRR